MDGEVDLNVSVTSFSSRSGELLTTTSVVGEPISLLADQEGIKPIGILGIRIPNVLHPFINRPLVESSLKKALTSTIRVGFMRHPRISGLNLELCFDDMNSSTSYSIGRGSQYNILATAIASPGSLIEWMRDFYFAHVSDVPPMHYPGYDNVLELVASLDQNDDLLSPYSCIASEIHRAQMKILHFPFKKDITVDGKTSEIDCDILCNQVRSIDIAVRIGLISESERETILSKLSNDQKATHVIIQGHARGEKAGAPDEDIDNLVIGDLGNIAKAAMAIREGRALPDEILDRQIIIFPPFSLSRRPPSLQVINYFKSNILLSRETPHRWLRSQTVFILEWLKSMRILENRLVILEGTSRGALMVWYMANLMDTVYEVIMRKPAGFRKILLEDLLLTGEENVQHQKRFFQLFGRSRALNGRDVESAEETELMGPPVKYILPRNAKRVTVHLHRSDMIVNGRGRLDKTPGITVNVHINTDEGTSGKSTLLNEIGFAEAKQRFNISGTNIITHEGNHYTPASADVNDISRAFNALRYVLAALPKGVTLQRRVIRLQDQFGNVYCRVPV